MKRIVLAVAVFFAITALVGADTSDYYPVRVDVVKVWSHADGFRVIYRKGMKEFVEAYIPATWFVPGGKAELIKAVDPSYPYMVVFYKGQGVFDHVKLYVPQYPNDPSWGMMSQEEGRGKFAGIEGIKLQF